MGNGYGYLQLQFGMGPLGMGTHGYFSVPTTAPIGTLEKKLGVFLHLSKAQHKIVKRNIKLVKRNIKFSKAQQNFL